ncbi:UspA domain-containing protein [Sporocytophaga myxococcoides]|uniref:UspA domain-containing protein n=1 Tax=Sporocytophaga myxococcoides TaxID=153721 RepID=A0A098LK72_9BACT|nr:universal stress protein [Sporocytophaga myxococcoides]GAL86593.1 UspA domain-containing protein [Sporocytophaga myxococcoides]
MEKLLLASDFSDSSNNALDFAKGIAAKAVSEVLIFNSAPLPVLEPTIPTFMMEEILEDQEYSAKEKLRESCDLVSSERYFDGSRVSCGYKFSSGVAVNEIAEVAQKENVELVVMGAYDNSITSKWIGSTTISTLDHVACPVLAVPTDAIFQGFQHIVYACGLRDYDHLAIDEVVNFAKIFNAKVTVLHVADPISLRLDIVLFDRLRKKVKATDEFGKVKFEMLVSEQRYDAIESFLSEEDVDMIALMKHSSSFFKRLFYKSMIDKSLYRVELPMFLLNEKNYKS